MIWGLFLSFTMVNKLYVQCHGRQKSNGIKFDQILSPMSDKGFGWVGEFLGGFVAIKGWLGLVKV